MSGPGDQASASRGRSHGGFRASHADRERVIGTLKAAFVQGMLAKDESTCGWARRSRHGPKTTLRKSSATGSRCAHRERVSRAGWMLSPPMRRPLRASR